MIRLCAWWGRAVFALRIVARTCFPRSAAFKPCAPLGGRVDYRHVASAPAVSVRPIYLCDREKVEYIHLNPVRRGLVENPEGWKWSSLPEFSGVNGVDQERFCGLRIDRVPLPPDVHTRI